jgi:hypothetical protein
MTSGGAYNYYYNNTGIASGTTTALSDMSGATNTFKLGNNDDNDPPNNRVGLVRVYNRVLTSGEVSTNYNSIKNISTNPYSLP